MYIYSIKICMPLYIIINWDISNLDTHCMDWKDNQSYTNMNINISVHRYSLLVNHLNV